MCLTRLFVILFIQIKVNFLLIKREVVVNCNNFFFFQTVNFTNIVFQNLAHATIVKTMQTMVRSSRKTTPFFMNEPIANTPRHACKSSTQTFEDLLRRTNITSYSTPTLSISNRNQVTTTNVTTQITHVFHTKVQCSRRFF